MDTRVPEGTLERAGISESATSFPFTEYATQSRRFPGVVAPNTDSGEFYEQSGTLRHHRRRNTRPTSRQRRFRTEQVLVFIIEQLGCGKLSSYSVRTVGAERSGCPAFNGPKADRSLPLWANTLRDAAEMHRRFRCEEIAGHLPNQRIAQLSGGWGFPASLIGSSNEKAGRRGAPGLSRVGVGAHAHLGNAGAIAS